MCQPPASLPKLTRSEREAMLASAEASIRKAVRDRVRPHEFDDVMQDVRLIVWQRTEAFDPARGVTWVTYATGIAKNHCKKHLTDNYHDPIAAAQVVAPADDLDFLDGLSAERVTSRPTADGGEPDADETAAGEAVRAVRTAVAVPLLAHLSPVTRAVVEAVAFGGLAPDQAAEQVGRSVKDAKLMIRNAALSLGTRYVEAGELIGVEPKAAKRAAARTARKGRSSAASAPAEQPTAEASSGWSVAAALAEPEPCDENERSMKQLLAENDPAGGIAPHTVLAAILPVASPARARHGRGWHFGKRLIPGSAAVLGRRCCRGAKR